MMFGQNKDVSSSTFRDVRPHVFTHAERNIGVDVWRCFGVLASKTATLAKDASPEVGTCCGCPGESPLEKARLNSLCFTLASRTSVLPQ